MEYILGLIIALIGGVVYFKNKAEDNAVKSELAETMGRDKELREQQEDVEAAISEIDKGIAKVKEDRARRRSEAKKETMEERADRW